MQNIFKEETRVISQYNEWFETFTSEDPAAAASVPQSFRTEVMEYIQDQISIGSPANSANRLNLPSSDNDDGVLS